MSADDLFDDEPDADAADAETGVGRRTRGAGKFDESLGKSLAKTHGRTPGEELAAIAYADPRQLAAEMGIKAGAALSEKVKALKALMPYAHRRLAPETDPDAPPPVLIIQNSVNEAEKLGNSDAPPVIDLRPADIRKIQQKQGVSISPRDKSDGKKSDND